MAAVTDSLNIKIFSMLKYSKIAACYFIALVSLTSCKKDIQNASQSSSITIVNASPLSPTITVSVSDTLIPFYINQAPISYQSSMEFGNPSGKIPLIIVSSADTNIAMFQGRLNLQPSGIYSLYITGQVKAPDTVFSKDLIPFYQDSSAGVRFINLVPGNQSFTVNLEGNTNTQIEFPALKYKQYSDFKTYSAIGGIMTYNFEIHDQSTGNLITAFSWNLTLLKNNTLVIAGTTDSASTTPVSVFQVNNY
jgi:hypothetical protein